MLVPGRIRVYPTDFLVEEISLYPAKGEGAHLYVRFEKTAITTDEAVRQLAAHAKVPVRDIGVAGMKDRHAVTIQTVSVPAPMSAAADDFDAHIRGFQTGEMRVLDATRHNNKLRTGHLRGNRFKLVVRDVPESGYADIEKAFLGIAEVGVPNAYGNQRFGSRGDNVERALAWLGGGPGPRDFKQRRFLYSALQSHIFNAVLEARLQEKTWNRAVTGDVLLREDRVLIGNSGDSLVQDDRSSRPGLRYCEDAEQDQVAVQRGDYGPSGPMFGPDMKAPKGAVHELETRVCEGLLGTGFDWAKTSQYGEGTRRHLRLWVEDMHVRWLAASEPSGTDAQAGSGLGEGSVEVEFVLPRGAYATTVLSNVFQLTEGVSHAASSPAATEIQETR